MSTKFGVLKQGREFSDNDNDFEVVAIQGNGTGIFWRNEIAYLLPDDTPVYPLDNDSQDIHTVGDIKKQKPWSN